MEVSHLWCHPQSLAILLMPQVLGSSLDRGERIEDTEQQNRPLAYSVLRLWETSRGQQHLEPPGTKRPGVCDTRSLGLDPGCLPFGGCSYTELEHYKKQRPRESCLLRITAFLWEGQIIIWGASACLGKPVSWSLDSGPHWVTLCKALSLSSCICKMGIIMLCFN